jgi:hypothetical protein
VLFAVAALLGCGNGDPATAVQLVLTPAAEVSTPAEILAELDRLEVVVDAPGGLGGVVAEGPLPGGGTAVDWDADGQLEARFAGPPLGDALPVLEIGLSQNVGRDLRFRVLGYPEGATRVVGAGGAEARISSGEVRRVGVPFSLAPWARPPRVLLMLPAQGVEAPSLLAEVNAVLSTTVGAESLDGHIRLFDPLGQPVAIAASLVADDRLCRATDRQGRLPRGDRPGPGQHRGPSPGPGPRHPGGAGLCQQLLLQGGRGRGSRSLRDVS